MLTDHQISTLWTRMAATSPLVAQRLDIAFKDQLPTTLRKNHAYFFNISDSHNENGQQNPGTHWVYFQCFDSENGPIALYFDSFGFAPFEQLRNRVRVQFRREIGWNRRQIQNERVSGSCGWYCLALALMLNRPYREGTIYKNSIIERYEDFLHLFEDDTIKNDNILRKFFILSPDDAGAEQSIPEDMGPDSRSVLYSA